MGIEFGPERWDKVTETYKLWWDGKLGRPVVPVELIGADPGREKPEVPLLGQDTCTDLSISAGDLIDRIDYELSCRKFLGDSFPYINMDCFGPGVMAAFCGASLDNSTGRVWFHPKEELPISEIHLEYDADNLWLNRIKEIYIAGIKRWQGQVIMGMPDLGGTLDILSTFRPGEKLLYDLYDYPEEVERLICEIHEIWHKVYKEFNELLQPVNPGYTDWSRIYSDKPSYILQCDFSYMLSPQMFKEFVLEELKASCRKLDRAIYHLDGKGELPHLDYLTDITELDVIQWVPGDGSPDCRFWPGVYSKIHDSGKKIQVIGNSFECLDAVISQIGGDGGSIQQCNMQFSISEEAEIVKSLSKYGL